MVTNSITLVTKDVYRPYLIQQFLPPIWEKWLECNSITSIFIHEDNVKPHISLQDDEFSQIAIEDVFDIHLCYQPPNSPYMNVLDLGFFRAIQPLQHQEAPRNIDEILAAVKKSFDELSTQTLNNVFVTLQLCMMEVMKISSRNNYKIPHIKNLRLHEERSLPTQICCDQQLDKIKQCL